MSALDRNSIRQSRMPLSYSSAPVLSWGMTLPFISYGGSSMLAMGLTLGMALALVRKRPGAYGVTGELAPQGAYA